MTSKGNDSHEPSKRERLSPEALRIYKVLENSIHQLKVVAALPALLQANRGSGVTDEELSRALHKHQVLIDQLETLEGQKEPEDEQDKEERKRRRAQLETDIKNSVRDLLWLIKARPGTLREDLFPPRMEAGAMECLLIRKLAQFQNLLTSGEEDLEETASSFACEMELLASEEETVAALMAEADARLSELTDEMTGLQMMFEKVNKPDSDMDEEEQCRPLMAASRAKQSKLQQEIERKNAEMSRSVKESKQVERELWEKSQSVQAETQELIQTFDDEMMELQADLEVNEMELANVEEELRKMENPFLVLEQEYHHILEKRRLAEEKRKQEMRELELKTRAAIFAQAWWRGYSTRKALKNKGKSKKAKKGKGKK